MGKRDRQRRRQSGSTPRDQLAAPSTTYSDEQAGGQLELRGALSAAARNEYAATLSGGLSQEDAWQRATELLFEKLTVSWTIAGLRLERQKELIGRYRMASSRERQFVRDSLRAHLSDNFPEMQAP